MSKVKYIRKANLVTNWFSRRIYFMCSDNSNKVKFVYLCLEWKNWEEGKKNDQNEFHQTFPKQILTSKTACEFCKST